MVRGCVRDLNDIRAYRTALKARVGEISISTAYQRTNAMLRSGVEDRIHNSRRIHGALGTAFHGNGLTERAISTAYHRNGLVNEKG